MVVYHLTWMPEGSQFFSAFYCCCCCCWRTTRPSSHPQRKGTARTTRKVRGDFSWDFKTNFPLPVETPNICRQSAKKKKRHLFLFLSTDCANSAAMELLKEQISNITLELNLLKEQQALHTGGRIITIILDWDRISNKSWLGNKQQILCYS